MLRVALLTMLETAADSGGQLRAFLRVAGLPVARQQLAVALALGCERVICLARELAPPLVALQHEAERAGARFNAITNSRGLAGLITAADEVIVLADGLFAPASEAAGLLDKAQTVLIQPIDQGLSGGFERIDLDRAAAGAMRIPGRLIERLAELPPDCDVASALQRIALQAGVTTRPIPEPGANGSFWMLVRSESEAHAIEPLWIRRRTRHATGPGPTPAMALLAVRSFGAALLHGGSGPGALAAATVALGAFALGAAWFGYFMLALGFLAVSAVSAEALALLGHVESGAPTAGTRPDLGRVTFVVLFDGALVAVLTLGTPGYPGAPGWLRVFPPLVLVGVVRLLGQTLRGRWVGWLNDRAVLAAAAALAIAAGSLGESVRLASILLLAVGLAVSAHDSRLTCP